MKRTIYAVLIEEEDGWIDRLFYCGDKLSLDDQVSRLVREEKGEAKCILIQTIEVEQIDITSPMETAVRRDVSPQK
jgi:hypothetical protein